MLAGREARAEHQRELLKAADDVCLVCFTVNMPGPVKQCAASLAAFEAGKRAAALAVNMRFDAVRKQVCHHEYGAESFRLVKADALEVKKVLAEVEETHPLGRLFDLDVLRSDGTKVSRGEIGLAPRRCIICGGNAADCAGGRVHSVKQLQEEIGRKVLLFLKEERKLQAKGDDTRPVCGLAGYMAYSAMAAEVQTTPKPGLVDRENCGSHTDMDLRSFEKSADAVQYYFGDCYALGAAARENGKTEAQLFAQLRAAGLAAERAMIRAANANTHKGLIFSLGIICGAWGFGGSDKEDDIFASAARIAAPAADEITEQGLLRSGARAEAAAGFPTLRGIALPAYDQAAGKGLDTETSGVWCLLKLIAGTADTNMIKRGGAETAREARARAAAAVSEIEPLFEENADREVLSARIIAAARKLDAEFIAADLSPGGCADLLAITFFMKMLEDLR